MPKHTLNPAAAIAARRSAWINCKSLLNMLALN
jgi:hypothetical protein